MHSSSLLSLIPLFPAGQTNELHNTKMASSSSPSAPFYLSPLDNIIGAPFVDKAFFFPTSSSDLSPLVQNLTLALAQTFNTIPLLAGTLTHLPDAPQKGRLAVTAPWRTAEDAFMVKDLRKTDYPSYETLRSKNFPMIDINYSILMPTRRSMHMRSPETDERPVLLAQINFINGGIILGFIIDHAFTDGAGTFTVARVWAAYCRGEDGSQLVSPDFIDRTPLMEGSDESARLEDFREYAYHPPNPKASTPTPGILSPILRGLRLSFVPSFRSLFSSTLNAVDNARAILRLGSARDASRSKPDTLAVEIFFFPKAKLKELKEMASKQEIDDTNWISTNDALASLLWCCITAAHKTDTHNKIESIKDETGSVDSQVTELSSLLAFVIDARRLVKPPLPARFIGNVLIWGSIIEPFSTVTPTAEGVTQCAHSLRRKIQQYDDTYLPRLIGAVKSMPDTRGVRLDRMGFDKRSLLVNSWAAQEWYDLDWGTLMGGRCERLRIHRPIFANFCLVLPELKGSEAGLEVIVSIKSDYVKTLRENELFNRFAEWRCS